MLWIGVRLLPQDGSRKVPTTAPYTFVKHYYVYMTAGANKFLRIYYGKVKECIRNLEQ